MTVTVKRMSVIALSAVVICICSWITVPFTVPFTMQTFAVFFVLLVSGGRDGTLAVALYILLGIVGVPVFSGFRGGIGHLMGPTGGYIIGFLFTGLIYMLAEPWMARQKKVTAFVLLFGLFLCYTVGTLWFSAVYTKTGNPMGVISILSMCVFPYIIPDLIKMRLAMFLAGRIRKVLIRI